jgi:4-amino-4-deoxy-L-arabinose transferase-like glycosyltransferase
MEKSLKIALFLAVLINFYFTLFLTPLFNLDEGAFSEATREMLLNHDFITTYLNGELRFAKPILIYWLQAVSVTIFGLNEFALRLPSAIAATLWTGGIYFFARRYFNETIALLGAFFMVTTLQIGLIAKAAIADSLLNMFIAFSMFSLFVYLQENNKKYLYLTFAFIGFGFLTKGPVAVLIPLATYFIWALIKKEFKKFLKDLFDIKGILIFSIIALPWYILEFKAQGMKFIDGFFLKNNIGRFETSFEKHKGSLFYYIPVVIIGLLPWTSLFFKYLAKFKEWRESEFFIFGSIWFLFVFIFFSLSGTKLPHYVIYGYTPLFIFMAFYFQKIKSEFLLSLPFVLFLIVLFALPFIARDLLPVIKDNFAKVTIITLLPLFDKFYFASIGALTLLSLFKFGKTIKALILGFGMIFVLNYVGWIYAHARAIPVKEAALYVKKHHIKKVVMYHLNTPSFNVYAKMLVTKRKPKPGDVAIMPVTSLKDFNYQMLYKGGVIALVKIKPKFKTTQPLNYVKERRD